MSQNTCITALVAGLVLGFALTDDAAAQGRGRSGGAPWGAGGPGVSTFNTPFGSSSETKPHNIQSQGWSGGEWGARGNPETEFETPAGPPSSLETEPHTTGGQ
jgi:hypothetical protein